MGSKSSSSTATNTTSNYYDQRSVNDAGGGIIGTGNSVDASQTWTDNSQTTWTQNTTVVDAGQTEMARQIALAAINAAKDGSNGATSAAIKAQENAISSNEKAIRGALDLASSSTSAAFKSSSDAMGWAGDRFDQLTGLTGDLLKASQKQADAAATNVAAAYNNAASQANGNKTLTIAALAAVGLVAAVVVFSNRKG